jgi:hypothetical protein
MTITVELGHTPTMIQHQQSETIGTASEVSTPATSIARSDDIDAIGSLSADSG